MSNETKSKTKYQIKRERETKYKGYKKIKYCVQAYLNCLFFYFGNANQNKRQIWSE